MKYGLCPGFSRRAGGGGWLPRGSGGCLGCQCAGAAAGKDRRTAAWAAATTESAVSQSWRPEAKKSSCPQRGFLRRAVREGSVPGSAPRPADDRLLPASFHIRFPLCLSLFKFPPPVRTQSYWVRAHPNDPHFNLITSLKTVSPHKVTPEVLGVRTSYAPEAVRETI